MRSTPTRAATPAKAAAARRSRVGEVTAVVARLHRVDEVVGGVAALERGLDPGAGEQVSLHDLDAREGLHALGPARERAHGPAGAGEAAQQTAAYVARGSGYEFHATPTLSVSPPSKSR